MDIDKQGEHLPPAGQHSRRQQIWIGSWLFLALGALAVFALLQSGVLHVLGRGEMILRKAPLAATFGFLVLAVSHYIIAYVTKHTQTKASRYNLVRLIRLISIVVVVGISISAFYTRWYTAAVSLGLISLILGFALQTPISSFIGWLYIILRNPYRVGDRIQLDTFKGDVVEIGYLDTTLWEFGGDYITSDLPSGRLIRFPNSMVLAGAVYNYSWRKFPYIWNEIPFHIAYESDFEWVAETIKREAKIVLGEGLEEHVAHLRDMIRETAIDKLEIKEYPFVTLRTNTNTWVEATLVYLVPPREASAVRSAILKAAIKALLAAPERVLFPKSNNR